MMQVIFATVSALADAQTQKDRRTRERISSFFMHKAPLFVKSFSSFI
jgi:hypothetical protein